MINVNVVFYLILKKNRDLDREFQFQGAKGWIFGAYLPCILKLKKDLTESNGHIQKSGGWEVGNLNEEQVSEKQHCSI